MTAAFRAFGGEDLVRDFLTSMPGGFWAQFFIVMAVIFVLGFFLDFIEIAVVVVPIVAPILLLDPTANVTAVWLGVMIGLNIQTSFLTPPFGFALFYLRGVASAAVKTTSMYKGVIPFILLQLLERLRGSNLDRSMMERMATVPGVEKRVLALSSAKNNHININF